MLTIVAHYRQPSARTTLVTVTPGATSPTNTLVLVLTDGVKTALLAYQTTTSVFASLFRSGTVRTISSRNVFSVLQVTRVIMGRT